MGLSPIVIKHSIILTHLRIIITGFQGLLFSVYRAKGTVDGFS